MPKSDRPGFWADFRKFFGRGLAILLPTVLTLWLLWQAATFVFAAVAEPINRSIRLATMQVMPNLFQPAGQPREWWHISQPEWWDVEPAAVAHYQSARESRGLKVVGQSLAIRDIRRERLRELWGQHWYLEGTGLVVAIVLIYFAGLLMTNYLGRKLYHLFERTMSKMPGFKQVYPHVKQVVEMVLGDKPMAFKRVVMVQYPRQGLWTLGLVTNNTFREMRRVAGESEMVSVFIPSTPTPFTGFIINAPSRDVVELSLTIDQALRFVITGGMLTPDDKQVAGAAAAAGLVSRSGGGEPAKGAGGPGPGV